MSTGHYINFIAFALVCLVLLVLPFVPAYQEWRYPGDMAELHVLPHYTGDVGSFFRRMPADPAARLGLEHATSDEEFDVVTGPVAVMTWGKAQKRLNAQGRIINIQLPVGSVQPLKVPGTIHGLR
jgi:hypothetical protein